MTRALDQRVTIEVQASVLLSPRSSGRGRAAAAAFVLSVPFLTACSPTCRLEVRFSYPKPLSPALFQLTGKKTCPPGPVGAAAPLAPAALAAAGLRSDDAEWQQVTVEPPGLRVVTAFRGSHCSVRVTGFYDSNGDGKVNSGDLEVVGPEVEVFDRGIFRGNLTVGPVLRLVAVP